MTLSGKKKEKENDIYCIKVLGSGCASCHALYENTKKSVQNMGLSVEVEYITDLKKFLDFAL